MRIAVLSDFHGNRTALEAVLADLSNQSPDLVLHAGDIADGGSSPIEVFDRIRDLGWPGVFGNTDEMLFRPASLEEFAAQSKAPPALWDAVREIATATRAVLGEERVAWLRNLPVSLRHPDCVPGLALVHASPADCWRAPASDAANADLETIYSPLGEPIVAYGHTHVPFIRTLSGMPKLVINTGSVGLPYDGDPRASYLLLDNEQPTIRRVAWDIEQELKLLSACDLPGAAWTAKMLRASAPTLP
ncbi:MAG TPA: metallophosphoesterase family protein [Acidobacteriaceae bacterium]|jgi:predicted phosphodiesterase|nr:metallophosphoesterase family protein [Acidobacteriaceae bacterium]